MKHGSFLLGTVFVVFSLLTLQVAYMPKVLADDTNCPTPSPSPSPSPDPSDDDGGDDGNSSNDPAFIMLNKSGNLKVVQQQAMLDAKQRPLKKSPETIRIEQAQYTAYLTAVKNDPGSAFSKAIEIWKGNESVDTQRLVVLKALELTSSSDETETLQFMLRALEVPDEQRTECSRLGRGNSQEKSIAAKRISLMESNPRLRSAK